MTLLEISTRDAASDCACCNEWRSKIYNKAVGASLPPKSSIRTVFASDEASHSI